jgi:crotonobetainyl-CoA:carnitine CoA-transferase CaiB-like acyl-CoA transferase
MPKEGALSGITVLDLSRMLPGPYCSMILADHGARVIAVEDKKFLADGVFFAAINRNKEHISLNLKTDQGKEICLRLAERADILIEQFRPGVVERLGVDYTSVQKRNPRIIYCSITGFGQTGPYRDRVGHDVNYLGISGVLDLIGEPDRPPSIPGVQIADIAGGGMNAAIGILLALQARERTGNGQYIDISMTDGMVSLMTVPIFIYLATGQLPGRSDALLSHRYACYNTYETADGRYITIGAVENRFWKRLCEILNAPEYSSLQYDEDRRQEIIDFFRRAIKERNLAEWEEVLGDLEICWGPIQEIEEVLQDPHFRERETLVDAEDQTGKIGTTIGVPIKLSDTPGSIRTSPVGFGQSTEAILKEIGYSREEIKVFSDNDVI